MFFEPVIQFDKEVVSLIAQNQDPVASFMFSFVTVLGDWWFVLSIFFVIALVLEERHRNWRLAALFLGFVGTQVSVFLLKYVIGRERPVEKTYSLIEGFSNTASFPSGHAATAVAFYGLLLFLLVKGEKNRRMKKVYLAAGIMLIFMIGFSRIYIGVHYTSDVLAGFLLGAGFLFLSVRVAERRVPHVIKTKIAEFKKVMQKTAKSDKIKK